MTFWPFGKRTLRPRIWPASAGTWRAAPGGLRKITLPPVVPIEAYRTRVSVPVGINGQQTGTIGAAGTVTLSAGPAGVGQSWAVDQAGIATSVGASDTATCAVYVGPQATAPYLVAQSYAGGGDAIGLAGYTLQPGEFVWAMWSGGTTGSTAQLNVTGTASVLVA
jgi:hypothetical protein